MAGCNSKPKQPEKPVEPEITKFSDNPNYGALTPRQYKHTTRQQIEEESELGAQAGSLWVMDGQGAYLFSQNKARRTGDLLNVKLEGPAQRQVETKISVIRNLLKRIEEKRKLEIERRLASENPDKTTTTADGKPAAPAPPVAQSESLKKEDEPIEIPTVPTRIVEKLADGNLRIKGAQPFMIGKREYKVIVAGIIRPEDFNDEGVSANKLLDAQYDVVSIRRSQAQ